MRDGWTTPVLCRIAEVSEAAAVGMPHPVLGEVVVLAVAVRPGSSVDD